MSWKIDSLVANSAINTEVMVSIAMRPLTRSAYQRKSSGCVGMVRGLRSGQYSLTTLARKAFTWGKVVLLMSIGEVPGELEVEWRKKLYINWEMSLEYK